ncbi:hypothetical protein [Labilibaculum filiforme]|nr:hypothetical protein [Labilibaculum filiforme]
MEQKHIRIGYFDNLKGEGSILISADIDGLLELEDTFLKLSQGLTAFNFSKLKLLDKSHKIKLVAIIDMENIGLIPTIKGTFEWKVRPEKWGEYREKLTALYRNSNSGHQYLDSNSIDNKDLQVIFSFNEYPLSF